MYLPAFFERSLGFRDTRLIIVSAVACIGTFVFSVALLRQTAIVTPLSVSEKQRLLENLAREKQEVASSSISKEDKKNILEGLSETQN